MTKFAVATVVFAACVATTMGDGTCSAAGSDFVVGDRAGFDMATNPMSIVADQAACCDACQNRAGCVAATYTPIVGTMNACLLKSTIGPIDSSSGVGGVQMAIPGFPNHEVDVSHLVGVTENCGVPGTNKVVSDGVECTVSQGTITEQIDLSADFKTVTVTFSGDTGDSLNARTITISNLPVTVTNFVETSDGYGTMAAGTFSATSVQIDASATGAYDAMSDNWVAVYTITYSGIN